MPWLIFFVSSAIVVYAAIKLAEYGDVIAVRTNLGGLLVGTILLAGATSLPELITSVSSFSLGAPDLAAGSFFGSNMVNMFVLALVDMVNYQVPLLRGQAITQTLTAALAVTLMTVATIFVLADVDLLIGWVSVESLLLIVLYFGGVWLVQQEGKLDGSGPAGPEIVPAEGFPSLRRGLIGFSVASIVLVAVVPQLVQAASDIATITGLGESFVGTALLSIVTSLPELLAAFTAVRLGSVELAVGNLFGSSVFNMLGLGVADFFYLEGSFLNDISNDFALVGLFGLLLTIMALVGNLARIERRVLFIELDALAIAITYLVAMYVLYLGGMGA
ncbi:MAG: sodium:calcium antiporter [Chloroflexota bacterium]